MCTGDAAPPDRPALSARARSAEPAGAGEVGSQDLPPASRLGSERVGALSAVP